MRICERTGSSLARAKSETLMSDFMKWEARFEEEDDEPEKLFWYMAALTHEVFEIPFRFFGKSGGTKPDHFLLKFKRGIKDADKPENREPTKAEVEATSKLRKDTLLALAAAAKARAKKRPKPKGVGKIPPAKKPPPKKGRK